MVNPLIKAIGKAAKKQPKVGAEEAIGKAAESAGMKAPVVAQKDLTTLQDFHTSLGDRIRAEAEASRRMMEGFDYKYDKGQRVFTKDSAAKNKAPYTILDRTRVGNAPMREDHPELGPGMGRPIIDPETGRAKRTPYEPGYRVLQEINGERTEFVIPQSAIIGDVEMARGGRVHISSNPDTMRLELNERRMGAGGLLAKAVKGAQKGVLPAAKREANLEKFLEPSAVKERMYHGTKAHDDYADQPGQAFQQFTGRPTWLAKEPYTAAGYSEGTGSTYPVFAQVKKPLNLRFDANDDANKAFAAARRLGVDVEHIKSMAKPEKAWEVINHPSFLDAVEKAGYDGISVNEGGYRTFGVLDPSKIKSATGNRGTYDITDPDINKAEGGEVRMQRGGDPLDEYYAPKARPSLGRRTRSDVDANVAIPRGLARGFVAGAAGAPGDLEFISRLLANTPGVQAYGEATGAATPGKYRKGEVGLQTRLPTSEEIEERLPFRGTSPLERAATGIGQIAGGFYTGPGAPIRAATAIPTAVVKAARDFGQAAGQTVSPLIVYHGSPHRFPPTKKNPLGEFDRTKIGTGEGAQAYGYGHYVAEAPGVGESYRMTTTGKLHELENIPATKKWQKDILDDVSTFMSRENVVDPVVAIDGYAKQLESLASSFPDSASRLLAKRDWLLSQKDVAKAKRAGHLYTVDLPDEKIAQMLDWDKPLSQQPKALQEVAKAKDPNLASAEPHFVAPDGKVIHWSELLESVDDLNNPRMKAIASKVYGGGEWVNYGDYMMGKTTGGDFYRSLAAPSEWSQQASAGIGKAGLDDIEASAALREAGIPGVRYLDQDSRGGGGQGTSNFVVFPGEEEALTILERKKGGGAVSMAGGGAISADDLIIEERPL